MSDLVAFLTARLDEDEAAANAAANCNVMEWHQGLGSVGQCSVLAAGRTVVDDHATAPEEAAHIARHDPARVLREVEAKRKILAIADEAFRTQGDYLEDGSEEVATLVLNALAAVYSEHPDYDPARA